MSDSEASERLNRRLLDAFPEKNPAWFWLSVGWVTFSGDGAGTASAVECNVRTSLTMEWLGILTGNERILQ